MAKLAFVTLAVTCFYVLRKFVYYKKSGSSETIDVTHQKLLVITYKLTGGITEQYIVSYDDLDHTLLTKTASFYHFAGKHQLVQCGPEVYEWYPAKPGYRCSVGVAQQGSSPSLWAKLQPL
jgi:hypothetical protein